MNPQARALAIQLRGGRQVSDDKTSDRQARIAGQWHGGPAVYETDGTCVGSDIGLAIA